jgi:hypothetical protein
MKFEVRIWEKAEHWYLDITIEAADENAAYKQLKKDYPPRGYSIRDIRNITPLTERN